MVAAIAGSRLFHGGPPVEKNASRLRRWIKRGLLVSGIVFVAIQLVPYGRSHENPPVVQEPAWDSARTRSLVARACFDCHSNETKWPWYSHVAPVSWLVQRDVDNAREHLNFSEWNQPQEHAEDAAGQVEEGEMPLWFFVVLHPEAKLTDDERRDLVVGLRATMTRKHGGAHSEDSDDSDD